MTQNAAETPDSRIGDKPNDAPGDGGKDGFFTVRRAFLLAIFVCGFVGFFAFDIQSYVTFNSLKQNREWLLLQVSENQFATTLAFIAIYAAIAGFSLPGAAVTSISGGFLFGLWFGTAWNVIGATIGATLLFLAARTVFADFLRKKAGPWLQQVETAFNKNAFSYLLFLRLVPVFPFFAVNLVPAFLGVRLRTFVLTTFIGIIPGGFVYTSFGAGLGAIFDRGEEFSVSKAITPEIIAGMLGLAVLSLLPAVLKMLRANRS
ncbi:MAG: TVP38/TMEM64 family protein [Alphaproteobacteria bacterium]|nr:TVP38/TMEM64 family protein [Alphaproteobacteria bacterium]